jgi:hypothetical protein
MQTESIDTTSAMPATMLRKRIFPPVEVRLPVGERPL